MAFSVSRTQLILVQSVCCSLFYNNKSPCHLTVNKEGDGLLYLVDMSVPSAVNNLITFFLQEVALALGWGGGGH